MNNMRLIDITKLPNIEYELESRSENNDYNKIYRKLLKSKSGKIKCTYNELDLLSAIYSDNDVYDYNALNIQRILYGINKNESFNYWDDSDKPKYNSYIGLSMQIDGTKTRIRQIKSRLNKAKYGDERNKYTHLLDYYNQLLDIYNDAMNNINNKKTEGMKLAAIVRDKDTGETKYIKDSDYNSKQAFKQDLQANGYIVSKIHDARDAYIIDHSNYRGINDLKKDLKFYEDMLEDAKKNYPSLIKTYEDDYNRVKKLYDEAMNQPLYESKLLESDTLITLYHNTSNNNAVKINKEGIKGGMRLSAYGKGSEAEGAGIWCTIQRGYGYGGATITFQINSNDEALRKQNDTEFILYRDVTPEEIIDIDLMISDIPSNYNRDDSINSTVESDIPSAIRHWGKDEVLKVFNNNQNHFVKPYDYNTLVNLINTGNKYCKGTIKLTESKKLIEVSRNEMLATSKAQTYTRYQKASGYKGFSIYDIDTTSILTTDSLRVTCKVGDYWDTVEMENILYWVQYYAELQPNNQVNARVCTQAIMDAIDAMDIKVDCTCADMQYRFAYKLSKMKAKYGKQETRPAKIRNPNDYGYLCKHLIAMLSNKKWLQQVSGTLMDFIEKRITEVNRYLRVKPGEELTLPNELARQNAKKGFYTKLFKNNEEEDNVEDNIEIDSKDNITNSNNNNTKSSTLNNVQGNNPSTNKVNSKGDEDNV